MFVIYTRDTYNTTVEHRALVHSFAGAVDIIVKDDFKRARFSTNSHSDVFDMYYRSTGFEHDGQ